MVPSVPLISALPVTQDAAVTQGNTQRLPPDVIRRNARLAHAFIASWRNMISSERDQEVDGAGARSVVDIADDVLVDSIVALLREHWMVTEGEASPSFARTVWGREDDDALVEHVVGPLRAQLLWELDEKVRAVTAQVHLALALHRAFTSTF